MHPGRMGIFGRESRGPAPRLEANEEDLGRWQASHLRGHTLVAIGGFLQLSNVRLTFTPHPLSRTLGWADWECALTDAMHVGVLPRGVLPWPPLLEQRFGIVHDGDLHLFKARNLDTIVAAIQAALAAAEG
jgi:hypothetical protein